MSIIYELDLLSNLKFINSIEDYANGISNLIDPENDFCKKWIYEAVKKNKKPYGWKIYFDYKKELAGVYCVYRLDIYKKTNKLLYVGCSKNISKRIKDKNHPYSINYNLNNKNSFTYVKIKETNDYVKLEKELIIKLKPILNSKNVK